MSARTQILAKLKAARTQPDAYVPSYRPPLTGDLAAEFSFRARASDAQLHDIACAEDLPEKLQSLFSNAQSITLLHIAPSSTLRALPWDRAPQLALHDTPPSGEAMALSEAGFAIAETGTLVFRSGPARPSSWHFLPGIECILLRRSAILPTLEDVFTHLAGAAMPATLNLVTGPSRTADIEQTIERGAHGPRALHIFLDNT